MRGGKAGFLGVSGARVRLSWSFSWCVGAGFLEVFGARNFLENDGASTGFLEVSGARMRLHFLEFLVRGIS